MCKKMVCFYGATPRTSATPQGQYSERHKRGSRISESHLRHYEPGMHLEDLSRAHQTGHSPLESDNITIPLSLWHCCFIIVDEGYFSHIHDTGQSCSSEELPCGFTPTGMPMQHRSQVSHLRINDLSVQETSTISMLQSNKLYYNKFCQHQRI